MFREIRNLPIYVYKGVQECSFPVWYWIEDWVWPIIRSAFMHFWGLVILWCVFLLPRFLELKDHTVSNIVYRYLQVDWLGLLVSTLVVIIPPTIFRIVLAGRKAYKRENEGIFKRLGSN